MTATGTQEAKRRLKAVPPAVERRQPGCFVGLVIVVSLCAAVFAWTGWPGAIAIGLIPAALLILAAYRALHEQALLLVVQRRWVRRGIRCLVVTSNSRNVNDYVRSEWLSKIGDAAVVLNWSERASWRSTLAVRLFKMYCSNQREDIPLVMVFRGRRRPYVFRFFNASREAREGRPQYLAELERLMFDALGLEPVVTP
jgi:hypothetical protein